MRSNKIVPLSLCINAPELHKKECNPGQQSVFVHVCGKRRHLDEKVRTCQDSNLESSDP